MRSRKASRFADDGGGAGQPGRDVFRQRFDLVRRHRVEQFARTRLRGGVVARRSRARGHADRRPRSGRDRSAARSRRSAAEVEIGAGPVDHRHDVVADDADASAATARMLSIQASIAPRRPASRARCRPAAECSRPRSRRAACGRARARSALCARATALRGHASPGGILMQRGDDLARAGLAHMVERDGIVRPVPAPRLPHRIPPTLSLAHILFVKPVSTFPGYAPCMPAILEIRIGQATL